MIVICIMFPICFIVGVVCGINIGREETDVHNKI